MELVLNRTRQQMIFKEKMKRLFQMSLGLLALLVMTVSAVAERKPNVVILFTDDQGTLDANCYGSKDLHTPNIDKLARTGVRFTQAYAHTVCCPSRAALMTGRHPQRSGINNWTQGDMNAPDGVNMSLDEVTLAEVLKSAGYQTALFGKWHLGAHRDFGPTRQGFDQFFGIRGGFIDSYNHFTLDRKSYHNLYEGTKEVWASGKYFPEMMADRCLEFIKQNQEEPFFLYAAFTLPHYPEQALEKYSKLYEKLGKARRSYAAVVSSADHYIGKIIDQLEDLNLRENTLIIFMSDNGYNYPMRMHKWAYIREDNDPSGFPKGHYYGADGGGNTGKWIGYKGTFLEGGVRVPAIVSYPEVVPQGEVRDQVVTVMDWYPTVLELCGVNPPENVKLDGKSLAEVMKKSQAPSPHDVLYFQWKDEWAVRQGNWKLIWGRGREALVGGKNRKKMFRLRNLNDEQPELKEYATQYPEIVDRLHKLHQAWEKEVTPAKP